MHTYSLTVAGLQRELPICKVTDDLHIGAFICFGDAELTVACAKAMLELLEPGSYDYLLQPKPRASPLSTKWPANPAQRSTSLPARGKRSTCLTPFMWRISPSPPPALSGCIWAVTMRR